MHFIIIVYIVVYQVWYQQSYRVTSPIVGSSSLALSAPDVGQRWLGLGGPYCLGSSSSSLAFTGYVTRGGSYAYDNGAWFSQRQCNRLDAAEIGTIAPVAPSIVVIPTLMTTFDQVARPPGGVGSCDSSVGMPGLDATSNCSWASVQALSRFVADAEWFQIEVGLASSLPRSC